MENETMSAARLLRMVGLFGIAIGIAWAIQALGFGASTTASRLAWIVAAASMSGAGAGLLIAAYGVPVASKKEGVRPNRLEPVFD